MVQQFFAKEEIETKYDVSTPVSEYTKTKWQKKILTNYPTVIGTLAELSFNGLTIGKTYQITLQAHHFNANNVATELQYKTNGTIISRSQYDPDSTTPRRSIHGSTAIFTAENSVLEAFVSQTDPSGHFENTDTWAILEELPNHEETTQWT